MWEEEIGEEGGGKEEVEEEGGGKRKWEAEVNSNSEQ